MTVAGDRIAVVPGAQRTRVVACCVGLAAAAYIAQCATPLRLNTDAMFYLIAAARHTAASPELDVSVPRHLPPGYPVLVAALDRLGLATPAGLVLLNLAALLLGLGLLLAAVEEDAEVKWTAALISLMSFTLVKHVTLPLSDLPYIGLSLASLAFVIRSRHEAGWLFACQVLASLALLAAAISVRTVGVALIPAFIYGLVQSDVGAEVIARTEPRRRRVSCAVGAGLVAVAAVVAGSKYLPFIAERVLNGAVVANVAAVAGMRAAELGEVFLNVPASKLPASLSFVVATVGILGAAQTVRGAWRAPPRRRDPADAYLWAYVAVVAIWPFRDARFWVPVIPIIALRLLGGVRRSGSRLASGIAAGVIAWFGVTGAAALAYSTRLSFSCEAFPERYGSGALAPAYRQYLRGEPLEGENTTPVAVLARYRGAGLFCATRAPAAPPAD